MTKDLYITGAGVSADSGIPTFRGNDGLWTVGSKNYTPQEMATRTMYEENPADFLLWYYRRFAALQDIEPNEAHFWLSDKLLITQNIDGLDGKAGNESYIPIHGRLDKLVTYSSQEKIQDPIDANWHELELYSRSNDESILKEALLRKCKISKDLNNIFSPIEETSLKPFVLLFDEYYTENYRISEAIHWMKTAEKMIFIGTSFSVNITAIALEIAIDRNIPIEIVDPEPTRIHYSRVSYHKLTAVQYCKARYSY